MIRMTTPYYDRTELASKYQMKRSLFLGKLTGPQRDTFNFSAAGMRLNILYNGQKIEAASLAKNILNRPLQGWDPVLGSEIKNDALREADRHIAEAGTYLEKMLRIAEAAQDPTLSDYERIQMQMDLGYLQHEMDFSNHSLGSGGSVKVEGVSGVNAQGGSLRKLRGFYHESNAYKMLERARSRILNGREWNVAEVRNTILAPPLIGGTGLTGYESPEEAALSMHKLGWLTGNQPIPFSDGQPGEPHGDGYSAADVLALYGTEDEWIDYLMQKRPEWNDMGNVFFEAPAGDPWGMIGAIGMRADDEDPGLFALGYVWTVTEDNTVPTVGEILKGDGRSVMDAEAAAVTAAELRRDLRGLEKKREELLKLAAEYMQVQDEPDDSLSKEAAMDNVLQFVGMRLSAFFNTLFRESFQFTFGEKYNLYGQTLDEYVTALQEFEDAHRPRVLNLEDMAQWDGPEVRLGEDALPGKLSGGRDDRSA